MARAENRPAPDKGRASASQKRAAQRARVLKEVVAELERGRGTKAAKLLRDGQDHGLFPTGGGLPRWLMETIGKEATGKLVEAFAQFPCFYCKDGLEPCESCGGRGITGGDRICEACAGLAVARCGFCDGSGCVTSNVVPPGLRLAVLAERVNRACSYVETVLQTPVPSKVSGDPVKAAKRCAKQLLALNRQLGVFENAVVASKNLVRTNPRWKDKLAGIVGRCGRAAAAAQKRARELVRQMGVCAQMQAEAPDVDSAVRAHAAQGSAFYEQLAASETFAGTALEHPYLQKIVAKLSRSK